MKSLRLNTYNTEVLLWTPSCPSCSALTLTLCVPPRPLSGISPNTATQVVHSAGRKFIVSPVPESRLREQFFAAQSGLAYGEKRDPGNTDQWDSFL